MTILSQKTWEILISEQIIIIVEYLPSPPNKVTNLKSRRKVDSSEWVLCRHAFCNLYLKLETQPVDLFASRLSYQLALYVAWKPDPYSITEEAISIPWTQGHPSVSVEQNSCVSSMAGFWDELSLQRVSEKTTQLIAKTRRQSTSGNYQSAWQKWYDWCNPWKDPPLCLIVFKYTLKAFNDFKNKLQKCMK